MQHKKEFEYLTDHHFKTTIKILMENNTGLVLRGV